MSNKLLHWGLVLVLGLPAVAQAALVSRLGGQAYYDDVLDITWLQDANLADTNAFGVGRVSAFGIEGVWDNGTMTWATANRWITAMNADGGTGYLGFNDWRLPTLSPVDGSATFNTDFSNNGTKDRGTGATGSGWPFGADFVSELGYMFYANLGNLGVCTPNGSGSPTSCFPQAGSGLINTAPFSNLQSSVYWSGLEFAPNSSAAWRFAFNGIQDASLKSANSFAWAVRAGDVAAPVPLPGTVLLMGSGLMALLGAKRSTRRGTSVI